MVERCREIYLLVSKYNSFYLELLVMVCLEVCTHDYIYKWKITCAFTLYVDCCSAGYWPDLGSNSSHNTITTHVYKDRRVQLSLVSLRTDTMLRVGNWQEFYCMNHGTRFQVFMCSLNRRSNVEAPRRLGIFMHI